jgi:hypothetical protein
MKTSEPRFKPRPPEYENKSANGLASTPVCTEVYQATADV